MTTPQPFPLPGDAGAADAATLYPAAGEALGLLVLAHGAGAGRTSPFMVEYASGLAGRGLDVVTFDFPYRRAGRRAPDKAPVLEAAFREAVAAAVGRPGVRGRRLLLGGKSMGGRMAVRVAADPEAWPASLPPIDGVVALGYPLRPPGRAIGDRASHFARLTVPTLIVQGTRDGFGGPDDIRAAAPAATVHAVAGGDHSFAVPKSAGVAQAAVHAGILDAIAAWARAILRDPSGGA